MSDPVTEIRVDRDKLAMLLREKKMSQSKLATYAKVSPAVVSRILSGKRLGVRMSTLLAFAHALRVLPNELVEDTGSPQLAELLEKESVRQESEFDLDDKIIARFLEDNPQVRAGLAKIIRGRPRALLRVMRAEIENYEEENQDST